MALEVVGSNPSPHPIINNNLRVTLLLLHLTKLKLNVRDNLNTLRLINSNALKPIALNKLLLEKSNRGRTVNNVFKKNFFKTLLPHVTSPSLSSTNVHSSLAAYYINKSKQGSVPACVAKLKSCLDNFINISNNCLTYAPYTTYFSNPATYHYTLPLINSSYDYYNGNISLTKSYSHNNYNSMQILKNPYKLLSDKKKQLAYITDFAFHKKTIRLLNSMDVTTIGLITSNLPSYSLNFSFPVLNDSFIIQLIFIRLCLVLKKANLSNLHSLKKKGDPCF